MTDRVQLNLSISQQEKAEIWMKAHNLRMPMSTLVVLAVGAFEGPEASDAVFERLQRRVERLEEMAGL